MENENSLENSDNSEPVQKPKYYASVPDGARAQSSVSDHVHEVSHHLSVAADSLNNFTKKVKGFLTLLTLIICMVIMVVSLIKGNGMGGPELKENMERLVYLSTGMPLQPSILSPSFGALQVTNSSHA